jgi:hypothetical protein
MPQRFTATENAIEKGLDKATPKTGAKLVEDWVKELESVEAIGVKGLHADLAALDKELKKDAPNGEHIQKLLAKLGPATVKLADKCDDPKVSEKVRSLGEALSQSGG